MPSPSFTQVFFSCLQLLLFTSAPLEAAETEHDQNYQEIDAVPKNNNPDHGQANIAIDPGRVRVEIKNREDESVEQEKPVIVELSQTLVTLRSEWSHYTEISQLPNSNSDVKGNLSVRKASEDYQNPNNKNAT